MNAAPRQTLAPLSPLFYERLVRDALAEDFGIGGDLTSQATIPAETRAQADLVAREAGIIAGGEIARAVFSMLDPGAHYDLAVIDGETVRAGTRLASVACDARALLGAERTALNLVSHLSGIATATARFVAAVGDRPCRVTETRKTLPGLRALQKYAVRAGGGSNHRFRLDDAILIKDNHVALAGGIAPALAAARRAAGHLVPIEIEVDSLAQLDEVLATADTPDCVLLDNFSLDAVREAVARTRGRGITIEVSGGVTLEIVSALAAAGVDVISVGSLTHSVRALDIGLDVGKPQVRS